MYTYKITFEDEGPRVTVYRGDAPIASVGHWADDGYLAWADQIIKDLETLGEKEVLGNE